MKDDIKAMKEDIIELKKELEIIKEPMIEELIELMKVHPKIKEIINFSDGFKHDLDKFIFATCKTNRAFCFNIIQKKADAWLKEKQGDE